jgi:hypothetical protein
LFAQKVKKAFPLAWLLMRATVPRFMNPCPGDVGSLRLYLKSRIFSGTRETAQESSRQFREVQAPSLPKMTVINQSGIS